MPSRYPLFLANEAMVPNSDLSVTNKATGEVFAHAPLASPEIIDQAIAAAVAARAPMAALRSYERHAVLEHCLARLRERRDELVTTLCIEAGKPIRDSRGEVDRFLETFKIASSESLRIGGEVLPLDTSPRTRAYTGSWRRFPIGPCSFISPFNFPLNLVAHKVAPALAIGCPFILKPASLTPISALILGEVLSTAPLPKGAFSILPCRRDGADLFTTDERLKLLSFTGSPDVGWELKRKAQKKKVVLELGGNAAVLIDEDADLADAAERTSFGAFYQSGQSCIGVQRIYVHASVYAAFRERLVAKASALKTGDPRDEQTDLGPLITEGDAQRLESWIASAQRRGARILCGGRRFGPFLDATLLENVPKDEKICAAEAFGPVAVLEPFTDFDDALREINDSAFGLQAGIFTRDLYRAQRAYETLEVGAVVIGDVPSFRVDHMPYGGVKDSGLGREGVRFAIEEMSEIRLLVVRDPTR